MQEKLRRESELMKWSEYDRRATVAGWTAFFASARVVNRFYARYRLARSFIKIELEGYADSTTAGYSALTRLVLHWSAFEQLKRAIHLKDTRGSIQKYDFEQCIETIKENDPNGNLFRFLRVHLTDEKQKIAIARYLDGLEKNPLILIKAIRHIYLHGPLTANVNGLNPTALSIICDSLCEVLAQMMQQEFRESVEQLLETHPNL
jgi:hypothetical protein